MDLNFYNKPYIFTVDIVQKYNIYNNKFKKKANSQLQIQNPQNTLNKIKLHPKYLKKVSKFEAKTTIKEESN